VPDDAPAIAHAASESLDHLRPFLPWAVPEKVTVEAQRRRLEGPEWSWGPESEHFAYGVFQVDGDAALVGGCGLHRRRAPGALEIGYWVHVAHVRRGIATTAARAMTDAGFTIDGIDTMEILCDVANHASAGVCRKLGYRLTQTIDHQPMAPGETGRRWVWVMSREEWCGPSGR
jgi:RimJ/RimL family protein N-acetyltransferase